MEKIKIKYQKYMKFKIIIILFIAFLILHTIGILRSKKIKKPSPFYKEFCKEEVEIYKQMVIEQQKDIDFYHRLLQKRSLRKAKKVQAKKQKYVYN